MGVEFGWWGEAWPALIAGFLRPSNQGWEGLTYSKQGRRLEGLLIGGCYAGSPWIARSTAAARRGGGWLEAAQLRISRWVPGKFHREEQGVRKVRKGEFGVCFMAATYAEWIKKRGKFCRLALGLRNPWWNTWWLSKEGKKRIQKVMVCSSCGYEKDDHILDMVFYDKYS
ncbi:hypothetical protein E3N88_10265 [Mikania micrantha]|uniref:Uncharacterized protein n=1 Tax=Mikania micrantha TaxID=192012 RepID=A0A5N6PC42_9ASTR|nr:hypothetical protein E3N88_10265 [Mikania micrantha]